MLSSANLLIQEYDLTFICTFFFLIRGVKLFFSVNSLSYSLFIIKILVLFVICRILHILILNLMLQIFFPICPLPLKLFCYALSFEYLYRWVFCSFPLWLQPLPFWFKKNNFFFWLLLPEKRKKNFPPISLLNIHPYFNMKLLWFFFIFVFNPHKIYLSTWYDAKI